MAAQSFYKIKDIKEEQGKVIERFNNPADKVKPYHIVMNEVDDCRTALFLEQIESNYENHP